MSVLLIKETNDEDHQTSRPVTGLIKGGNIVNLWKKTTQTLLGIISMGKNYKLDGSPVQI